MKTRTTPATTEPQTDGETVQPRRLVLRAKTALRGGLRLLPAALLLTTVVTAAPAAGATGCAPRSSNVIANGGTSRNETTLDISADGGTAVAERRRRRRQPGGRHLGSGRAGNGGEADADADGGTSTVGDVNSGNNRGNVLDVGSGGAQRSLRLRRRRQHHRQRRQQRQRDRHRHQRRRRHRRRQRRRRRRQRRGRSLGIAAAGNGGEADASADGGTVTIGDVNSGGNTGNDVDVDYQDPSRRRAACPAPLRAACQPLCPARRGRPPPPRPPRLFTVERSPANRIPPRPAGLRAPISSAIRGTMPPPISHRGTRFQIDRQSTIASCRIRGRGMGKPTKRRSYRPLTDKQQAAIAWGDPAESSATLADHLGRSRGTVDSMRRRIATLGAWGCPLRWTTCEACGKPLASRNTGDARRFHPACWAARRQTAVRIWTRERARRWWEEWSAEQRAQSLATLNERADRDYALTKRHASHHGAPWTAEDDAVLKERDADPMREVGLTLGRTAYAVRDRKIKLRRRGILPLASLTRQCSD